MTMKNMLLIVFVAILVGCAYAPQAEAAELSRADAAKILASMGHTNVVIGGVVNGIGSLGVGAFSGPNVAMVFYDSDQDNEPMVTFFYDKEIGWFYQQVDHQGHRVRLWTTTGYKELKPPPPPAK